MDVKNKATRIELFSLRTPQMRAFHMSWFAFFLCFFSWFGIAPLMPVVRKELGLTPEQVGNTIIASVSITILARFAIGWLCDNIGPRKSYTVLLLLGSLPVMAIRTVHTPGGSAKVYTRSGPASGKQPSTVRSSSKSM